MRETDRQMMLSSYFSSPLTACRSLATTAYSAATAFAILVTGILHRSARADCCCNIAIPIPPVLCRMYKVHTIRTWSLAPTVLTNSEKAQLTDKSSTWLLHAIPATPASGAFCCLADHPRHRQSLTLELQLDISNCKRYWGKLQLSSVQPCARPSPPSRQTKCNIVATLSAHSGGKRGQLLQCTISFFAFPSSAGNTCMMAFSTRSTWSS